MYRFTSRKKQQRYSLFKVIMLRRLQRGTEQPWVCPECQDVCCVYQYKYCIEVFFKHFLCVNQTVPSDPAFQEEQQDQVLDANSLNSLGVKYRGLDYAHTHFYYCYGLLVGWLAVGCLMVGYSI